MFSLAQFSIILLWFSVNADVSLILLKHLNFLFRFQITREAIILIEKLDAIKDTILNSTKDEMMENLQNITMQNLTITDMETANNVSLSIDTESKNVLDSCSKIRFALGVFVQGLNAFKYLVKNNKNIGLIKMESIIKFNGYKYFSRTQYDKRYSNSPYVLL